MHRGSGHRVRACGTRGGERPDEVGLRPQGGKVQHAVSAALVVKKHAAKKPAHVTHTTVSSSTLPFTGLDLGFLAGAGLVLVVMGASLRRITRKSQI